MAADETYTVAAHPPLVSQVCLRCGAQVGSRSIHDAWHEAQTPRFAAPQPHRATINHVCSRCEPDARCWEPMPSSESGLHDCTLPEGLDGEHRDLSCPHDAHYGDAEGNRVCVLCGATRPVNAPGEQPAPWSAPARKTTG